MNTEVKALSISEIVSTYVKPVAFSLLMAAVIAISAKFSVLTPVSPVPVTLQVAAVLAAGFLLGPRWGLMSVLWYIGAGLLGAPVFAMGISGPAIFVQASFGYILAFGASAWLVGLLSLKARRTLPKGLLIAFVGVVLIYLVGAFWMAGWLMFGGAAFQSALVSASTGGIMPFVIVDILKSIFVAGVWVLFAPGNVRNGK